MGGWGGVVVAGPYRTVKTNGRDLHARRAVACTRRARWRGTETFRLNFHHFDRFEPDLHGHIHVRGAALSCLRLKLADNVLILTFLRPFFVVRAGPHELVVADRKNHAIRLIQLVQSLRHHPWAISHALLADAPREPRAV